MNQITVFFFCFLYVNDSTSPLCLMLIASSVDRNLNCCFWSHRCWIANPSSWYILRLNIHLFLPLYPWLNIHLFLLCVGGMKFVLGLTMVKCLADTVCFFPLSSYIALFLLCLCIMVTQSSVSSFFSEGFVCFFFDSLYTSI